MTDVVALHRASKALWAPDDGEVRPVHRETDLEELLCGWRGYGEVAQIHSQSHGGRGASITALGIDGWLVRLRDTTAAAGGWPRSAILTKLLEDGSLPPILGDSRWYAPDPSTDLAGTVLIAEEIQFEPANVSRAVWAWLSDGSMPSEYAAGRTTHDSILVESLTEALDLVTRTGMQSWPADAVQAAVELAEELQVDRVVVTSPRQIVLRVPGTSRRVRIQCHGRDDGAQVRAVDLTDSLGHVHSVRLPDRQTLRISRVR